MKKNNKGFTLAELLIVVAIIAVLVAIAIPIFTTQLEKSREATDAANIRDYYAEISVALLDGKYTADTTVTGHYNTLNISNTVSAEIGTVSGTAGNQTFSVTVSGVTVNQTQQKWQSGDQIVAGCKIDKDTDMVGKNQVIFNYKITANNTYLDSVTFGTAGQQNP